MTGENRCTTNTLSCSGSDVPTRQRAPRGDISRFHLRDHWLKMIHRLGYSGQTDAAIQRAILDLYRTHKTCKAVADLLDVNPFTIRVHLVKLGEPRSPRGGRGADRRCPENFLELDGVRKHYTEWAQELGWSRSVVYHRKRCLGWSDAATLTTPLAASKRHYKDQSDRRSALLRRQRA